MKVRNIKQMCGFIILFFGQKHDILVITKERDYSINKNLGGIFMKKALAMLLVMGLSASALAGCGNKNTEQKTQDTADVVTATEETASTSSD